MKTTRYYLLTLFVLVVFFVQAQPQKNRPRIEDMHNNKWTEISTKANLSEKEKTAVYPVFKEYETAVWNVFKQNRELMKSLRDKKDNASLNYEEANDKYIDQEVKQAELLKGYHEKLTKLLPPKKLFDYYQAERVYKRQLLQNMPPHSKRGQ